MALQTLDSRDRIHPAPTWPLRSNFSNCMFRILFSSKIDQIAWTKMIQWFVLFSATVWILDPCFRCRDVQNCVHPKNSERVFGSNAPFFICRFMFVLNSWDVIRAETSSFLMNFIAPSTLNHNSLAMPERCRALALERRHFNVDIQSAYWWGANYMDASGRTGNTGEIGRDQFTDMRSWWCMLRHLVKR